MKTLKYLALLLLATTLICSCSSDDDNGSTETPTTSDPILGIWNFTARVNVQNGEEILTEPTDCQQLATFEFRPDQTFTFNFVFGGGTECLFSDDRTGTWENNGDGTYTLSEENELILDTTLEGDDLIIMFLFSESIGEEPPTFFEETRIYTQVQEASP